MTTEPFGPPTVPPPCSRWPTCEGYERGWMDPTVERDPDTCTWPNCRYASLATAQAAADRLNPEPFGPSREGSPHCQSGSLASGGTRTFCTCDTCF